MWGDDQQSKIVSAAEYEVELDFADPDAVTVAEASGHAWGETAIVEEGAVGTSEIFDEIAACISYYAGMLPRAIGSGVIVGEVEVWEDLAGEGATTDIEGVFEDAALPEDAVGAEDLKLAGGPTREGGAAAPAEMGLWLVGGAANHADTQVDIGLCGGLGAGRGMLGTGKWGAV